MTLQRPNLVTLNIYTPQEGIQGRVRGNFDGLEWIIETVDRQPAFRLPFELGLGNDREEILLLTQGQNRAALLLVHTICQGERHMNHKHFWLN